MNFTAATLAFGHRLASRFARARASPKSESNGWQPVLAEIRSSSAALTDTVAEIETRFLQISTTVENTTNIGRELVERGEALIALALGQGGGQICIEATAEHIWRSIECVERSLQESEDLIGRLTLLHGQLSQSLAAERELAGTLAPLTFVQSLFRVESARLSPDVQTMFLALVAEMERVRLNVENEFRAKFQLIRDIRAILTDAIAQLKLRSVETKKHVVELRAHLELSLRQMQESHERNRDRNSRLSAVSQAVAAETGRIVMSLQFYDTFTQKLQHTRRILDEMDTTASALPTAGGEAGRSLRFLEQSGLICAAQLAAMQAEFVQSGAALRDGIGGIVNRMTTLDEDCIALRDLDNVSAGVDGAVQILLDSLVEVQRLVGGAATFAMESHRTIEPIKGNSTNFARFINNLSFEIQLIGLNAEIQSTHVGRGTGLEVLSAQTSAISRETRALSTKLAVDLDELTAGLSRVVTAFEDIRDRSVAYNRTLAAEAATDTASLHAYRDSSLDVLRQIGELLPKLQTETRAALDQADFVAIARQPLARLENAVVQLTSAARTDADRSGVMVDTTGLTDHFLTFYTMVAEGEVHRKALGLAPVATSAPTTASGDVDLFGDEPIAPATPVATSSGDVELFGFDEPAPAAVETTLPAPSAPPAPAAGNVDLWLDEPTPITPPGSVDENARRTAA